MIRQIPYRKNRGDPDAFCALLVIIKWDLCLKMERAKLNI
jgi:hypothetical protein